MPFIKKKKKFKKRDRDDQDFIEPRKIRRKPCKFCADRTYLIDYKEISRLRIFISDRGKTIPKRITGNCAKHQRQLTEAIMRGRNLALLAYSAE